MTVHQYTLHSYTGLVFAAVQWNHITIVAIEYYGMDISLLTNCTVSEH